MLKGAVDVIYKPFDIEELEAKIRSIINFKQMHKKENIDTIIKSLFSYIQNDSKEIIKIAKEFGLEVPFVRPSELAQDDSPALPVITHAVEWLKANENYEADYIILLQPTSPLRTADHIDEALSLLINSDADSIVSVVRVPHNCNPSSVMKLAGKYLKP